MKPDIRQAIKDKLASSEFLLHIACVEQRLREAGIAPEQMPVVLEAVALMARMMSIGSVAGEVRGGVTACQLAETLADQASGILGVMQQRFAAGVVADLGKDVAEFREILTGEVWPQVKELADEIGMPLAGLPV